MGGPGFGQLKLALVNEISAVTRSAPAIFGTAAPDTGNMEILAAYGTEEQKERWLKPLLNQEMLVGLLDDRTPGRLGPQPVQDRRSARWRRMGHQRREVVHLGRAGRRPAVRDVHQRHLHRPRETPGIEIMPGAAIHNHIMYTDVRVPPDHLLGPEDGAKVSRSAASAAVASTTRCARSHSAR